MRGSKWLACLWPGLPELWLHGSWSGLFFALGFSLVLNGTLAVHLVWTELVGEPWRTVASVTVAILWLLGLAGGIRSLAGWTRAQTGDLFSRATNEYLTGNWFAAELLLNQLIRQDRLDVDARLMLATMYRRTRRFDEALRACKQLQLMEGAEKWSFEIEREMEFLAAKAGAPVASAAEDDQPVRSQVVSQAA